VDETLIRAWASHKSFVPKDGAPPPSSGSRGNPEVDLKGQRRTNDTHGSKTDPDPQLYTKSSKTGAIPCYMGHVLTENRNGLVVDTRLTQANGTAEREAALEMLAELPGEARKTVGADKAYHIGPFVEGCREINVTPHVAQNTSGRSSRIDQRTTRHTGYQISGRVPHPLTLIPLEIAPKRLPIAKLDGAGGRSIGISGTMEQKAGLSGMALTLAIIDDRGVE